jgi:hypothetical protein
MSRFSGPQGRGAAAQARQARRAAASMRAEAAAVDAAMAEAADAALAAACEWPWKDAYENEGRAKAALRRMQRSRKGQGLHPYPCPARHWHLGRTFRRVTAAWRASA